MTPEIYQTLGGKEENVQGAARPSTGDEFGKKKRRTKKGGITTALGNPGAEAGREQCAKRAAPIGFPEKKVIT